MPYVNPRMAMLAILPEEGMSPEAWIQAMDSVKFKALMETAASKSIDLAFPKFETRYEDSLLDELEVLGMGKAFVPGEADFSLMQPSRAKDLFISAVQHKTFIRADEKGTEAAAVTSVEVSLTSMPMFDEAISFDRPFVYAILDTETAVPLFIGVLYDPAK
jgi:serpin B